jgi:hypothetical protein
MFLGIYLTYKHIYISSFNSKDKCLVSKHKCKKCVVEYLNLRFWCFEIIGMKWNHTWNKVLKFPMLNTFIINTLEWPTQIHHVY